jgi:hypothetical protein
VLNITVPNAAANGGFLTIYPTGSSLPNSSNLNFNAGQTVANLVEVGLGINDNISIYNYNGTNNVIVDIEGYYAPSSETDGTGQFVPLNPMRICDTRPVGPGVAANQCNETLPTTIAPNSTKVIDVVNQPNINLIDGVPMGASAVVLNVTVPNATADGGFLTIYPTGESLPNSSNLNFNDGQTVANRVIVPVSSNGDISIYNYDGNTNIVVDVNGYYMPPLSTTTHTANQSGFTPLVPIRICDTRPVAANVPSNQCNNGSASTGTLSANQTITVNVSGTGQGGTVDNIPATATGVVLNVTVTDTTANGGFLTIYPTPTSAGSTPTISDLNWSQGQTVANLTVVELGASGSINIYNAFGSADVIVDVFGYYTPVT